MDYFYKFGPAVFKLRDFSVNSFLRIWLWKLDPYRIENTDECNTELLTASPDKYAHLLKSSTIIHNQPSGFYARQIFKAENGDYFLHLKEKSTNIDSLLFHITKDFKKISLLIDNTETSGQAAFEYIGRSAIYSMISLSVLGLHGVLTEHNGMGFIITAPSETGKTTHARLWRDNKNALIINGDNACCYKKNGAWVGFGVPWCGTSGEEINRSVPVKSLVILERGKENKAEIISTYEAFSLALSSVQCPVWDRDISDKAIALFDEFLNDITVIRLKCTPDAESVEVLEKALEEIE